jgi:hypothetical protein
MSNRVSRILITTLALALAASATALASAIKGKTYEGHVPTKGVKTELHHAEIGLHAGGNIVLKVAGNGRTVKVSFSSSSPVLYCNTGKTLQVQTTKPAKLSSSGSFSATVNERFSSGPGAPAIQQVVSGHFSGSTVHGTIRTNAPPCSGVTGFSARAR